MDYQKLAGDLLFGGKTLNNAIRGHFIEALTYDALLKHDGRCTIQRWHYVGLNWGPWDVQRGTAQAKNRVRFQVRAKAARQLFGPGSRARHEYELGWKTTLSSAFQRDFDKDLIGECEPVGYRCDFFLFAWHGPNPATDETSHEDDQSDPNNYDYFIVPAREFSNRHEGPAKRASIRQMFEKEVSRLNFVDLPLEMNKACDRFLQD